MSSFDPNAAAPGTSGIYGLPHSADESQVVLVPVPFEATTSYGGGTSRGPSALKEASRQVDLFDVETGKPYAKGIAMLDEPAQVLEWNARAKALAQPIIESGGGDSANLDAVNALSARVNDWVYKTNREWLERGRLVGTVGGDHSVSYGAIKAHAERYPGLGVLHLDAHADLRCAYEGFTHSHASVMYNVLQDLPGVHRLVQVGIRDLCDAEKELMDASKGRVVTHFDVALASRRFDGVPWHKQVADVVSSLPGQVYLSFDIDGLDPTLCPHTGTPVPGGLSFQEACALVAGVARSGRRIVGFDLTEVSPGPEGDEWDANVGARLLYKMIGWSLHSTQGRHP